MAIVIEENSEFYELATNYNDALRYIKYLESKLDAAVYQEQEFNKKFTERDYADEESVETK